CGGQRNGNPSTPGVRTLLREGAFPPPAADRSRFFDGEELFFKGSASYLGSLDTPAPYAAVINIDMVGFNPIADRLDLVYYTNGSAALRDQVIAANDRYRIGVAPLVPQLATSGAIIL